MVILHAPNSVMLFVITICLCKMSLGTACLSMPRQIGYLCREGIQGGFFYFITKQLKLKKSSDFLRQPPPLLRRTRTNLLSVLIAPNFVLLLLDVFFKPSNSPNPSVLRTSPQRGELKN